MSLHKFFSNERFHIIAADLRADCDLQGIELNYRYFNEPQDPACLHVGLHNDYALIQIVLWETGLLEFNTQLDSGQEQFQASKIHSAGSKQLCDLLDRSITWLVERRPASELHRS